MQSANFIFIFRYLQPMQSAILNEIFVNIRHHVT